MTKLRDPSWEALRQQTHEKIASWDEAKKDRALSEIVDAIEGRRKAPPSSDEQSSAETK